MKLRPSTTPAPLLGACALAFGLLAMPTVSRADVQHVVARGHTLEAIARRYRVRVDAIVQANHLRNPQSIKPGDTLTIPGVVPSKSTSTASTRAATSTSPSNKAALKAKSAPTKPVTYAMRSRSPGVVHVVRLGTSESFTVRVGRGQPSKTTQKIFERMMRASSGLSHTPDPRLISLLTAVSDHFGSRPLQVVSGFRPYSPAQHTPHSNHNIGRAIDFRVVGVPNEVVRDYCRKFKNVGVGYYPNSSFVHLDVRESPSYWVDYSKPGEAPRYNAPNAGADEGTSDVAMDAPMLHGATDKESGSDEGAEGRESDPAGLGKPTAPALGGPGMGDPSMRAPSPQLPSGATGTVRPGSSTSDPTSQRASDLAF